MIAKPHSTLARCAQAIERHAAVLWAVSTMWVNPECLPPHMQRPELKARDMHYARQGYWLAAWCRNLTATIPAHLDDATYHWYE